MARWDNNPAKTELRPLYGPYDDNVEAKVVSVDTIQGQTKDNGTQSLAVRLKMEFVSGPPLGKKIDGLLWLHSEESQKISKQAQMAVYGYTQQQEAEFNEFAEGLDWLVDGDTKEVGDAWRGMIGRVVSLKLDIKPNKQNGEMQQQIGWRPVV